MNPHNKPAFPIIEAADGLAEAIHNGLSKREWVATQILAALIHRSGLAPECVLSMNALAIQTTDQLLHDLYWSEVSFTKHPNVANFSED